jgi:hypothetical protein
MSKKNIQKKSLKRNTQKTRKLPSDKKKGGFIFNFLGFGKTKTNNAEANTGDSTIITHLKDQQKACHDAIQVEIDKIINKENNGAPAAANGTTVLPPPPPNNTVTTSTPPPPPPPPPSAQAGGKKRNNKTKKNKK